MCWWETPSPLDICVDTKGCGVIWILTGTWLSRAQKFTLLCKCLNTCRTCHTHSLPYNYHICMLWRSTCVYLLDIKVLNVLCRMSCLYIICPWSKRVLVLVNGHQVFFTIFWAHFWTFKGCGVCEEHFFLIHIFI